MQCRLNVAKHEHDEITDTWKNTKANETDFSVSHRAEY